MPGTDKKDREQKLEDLEGGNTQKGDTLQKNDTLRKRNNISKFPG